MGGLVEGLVEGLVGAPPSARSSLETSTMAIFNPSPRGRGSHTPTRRTGVSVWEAPLCGSAALGAIGPAIERRATSVAASPRGRGSHTPTRRTGVSVWEAPLCGSAAFGAIGPAIERRATSVAASPRGRGSHTPSRRNRVSVWEAPLWERRPRRDRTCNRAPRHISGRIAARARIPHSAAFAARVHLSHATAFAAKAGTHTFQRSAALAQRLYRAEGAACTSHRAKE